MKGAELTIPSQREPVLKRAVACLAWGFIAKLRKHHRWSLAPSQSRAFTSGWSMQTIEMVNCFPQYSTSP